MEHRTPKSRYTRTSRKFFVKQLSQIERRENRLRKLRNKLVTPKGSAVYGDSAIALCPQSHHHMGKSEDESEHIGEMLKAHSEDPAVMVRPVSHYVYLSFNDIYGYRIFYLNLRLICFPE